MCSVSLYFSVIFSFIFRCCSSRFPVFCYFYSCRDEYTYWGTIVYSCLMCACKYFLLFTVRFGSNYFYRRRADSKLKSGSRFDLGPSHACCFFSPCRQNNLTTIDCNVTTSPQQIETQTAGLPRFVVQLAINLLQNFVVQQSAKNWSNGVWA